MDSYSTKTLYQLIVRQLKDDGFEDAATVVANETSAALNPNLPSQHLSACVQKAMAVDAAPAAAAPASATSQSTSQPLEAESTEHTHTQHLVLESASSRNDDDNVLVSAARAGGDGGQVETRELPGYATRYVTSHQQQVTVTRISGDGMTAATASTDTSIKILDVTKMHQHEAAHRSGSGVDDMLDDNGNTRNSSVSSSSASSSSSSSQLSYVQTKPVTKTLYDHTGRVNDLDFHPVRPFLATCSDDGTVKLFDHATAHLRRCYRSIDETCAVNSVHFHSSGDFLLVGTQHHMCRLYDVNTFQCFTSPQLHTQHTADVYAARWSPQSNVYATCGADGSIKIWDTASSACVRSIGGAHGGAAVTSVQFSGNGRYLLSGGYDSVCRLWCVASGRCVVTYTGAENRRNRTPCVFSYQSDFVFSGDDRSGDIVAWDTRTGVRVDNNPRYHGADDHIVSSAGAAGDAMDTSGSSDTASILRGHLQPVTYIAASPTEAVFLSGSADHRVRFWSVADSSSSA